MPTISQKDQECLDRGVNFHFRHENGTQMTYMAADYEHQALFVIFDKDGAKSIKLTAYDARALAEEILRSVRRI